MGKFKVWIEQVNQALVEVVAVNEEEAIDKAYRKWRREDGHSRVSFIEEEGKRGHSI